MCIFRRFRLAWFDERDSLFSAIGTVLTLIGLAFAIWQIRDTKQALVSNVGYQIFKDNDEIIAAIQDDEYSAIFKYDQNAPYSEALLLRVERDIHRVIVFNTTIWRQHQAGMVDSAIWDGVSKSFCSFLKLPLPNKYWTNEIASGRRRFDETFVKETSACVQPTTP